LDFSVNIGKDWQNIDTWIVAKSPEAKEMITDVYEKVRGRNTDRILHKTERNVSRLYPHWENWSMIDDDVMAEVVETLVVKYSS